MNINDKVYIIHTGNKYKNYELRGMVATIVNIYGITNQNCALKIDGIRNRASSQGLFYLPMRALANYKEITPSTPANCKYIPLTEKYKMFCIKRVIFNKPATIVIWYDNTKTVVKRQKGDRWDEEKGLAMCIVKKLFGNTGKYYELFKRYCNE